MTERTESMAQRIAKAQRLDNRRVPRILGRGPDLDGDEAGSGVALDLSPPNRLTAEGGFWKTSEHLKCYYGREMVSDERGLPPGYAEGPTWRRSAREERAVVRRGS